MTSTELRLVEGAPPDIVDLSDDVALGLVTAKVITAHPFGPGRWEISDAGRVGVARISDVTVWIQPKLAIARLMWLLGYAHRPAWAGSPPVGYARADDLLGVLADAVAAQIERALGAGLLQGYEEIDDTASVLRGRLREHEQLRRRYGLAVPLLVRYDDHRSDIAENQILAGAVDRLLRLPGIPTATVARLRKLRHRLAEITPLVPGRPLPVWRASRLNARYHDALWLAELILAGGSVEDLPGGLRLDGFLINMASLFESFVTEALSASLARLGGTGRAQDRWWLDDRDEVLMKPDLVWYVDGDPAAVVDAKYKAQRYESFPNADIYQLLAYATRLGLTEGHLVYAKGNGAARSWRIRNANVTVTAHTLELDVPPVELLLQVDSLAARVGLAAALSADASEKDQDHI